MKKLMVIMVLALLMVPGVNAQTEDSALRASSVSERYSIELPDGWVSSTQPISGLQDFFVGEILIAADSEEALRALQLNKPSIPQTGHTLVANIFPTAWASYGVDATDSRALFSTILTSPLAEQAEYFEINGYPAARTIGYGGAPYTQQEFSGQTAVIVDELVYLLVYRAPDNAGLEMLADIAETLTFNPADRAPYRVTNEDGTLSFEVPATWLVTRPATMPTEVLGIVPEPAVMLDYLFGSSVETDLPGLYGQIEISTYEHLFNTADVEASDSDRQFVIGQNLAELGGELTGAPEPFMWQDTLPAMRMEFSLDNARGQMLLIDSGQEMYAFTLMAPAEEWDMVYAPQVQALLDSIEIAVPETLDTAGRVEGVQVGQLAPDFTAPATNGDSLLSLADYRGQVVLLNFWASWCPPCHEEAPDLQVAYEQYQENGVVILGVNLQETGPDAQAFIEQYNLTFPTVLDPDGEITRLYRVTGYPTTYLIDREGVIRASFAGPLSMARIDDWLTFTE